MHLFLVRHAESVDNVAGLLAGSRDAALSSHGALQAQRLATHLVSRSSEIGTVQHLFSSDLQRTRKTAEAIVAAHSSPSPSIVEVSDLRERDFRSREGESFRKKARTSESSMSTKRQAPTSHPESFDEMSIRARRFLDAHLLPILEGWTSSHPGAVVVVSHGIFLGVLSAELQAEVGPGVAKPDEAPLSLSNTGYVEFVLSREQAVPKSAPPGKDIVNHSTNNMVSGSSGHRLTITLKATNQVHHLTGLNRTKGGIGNAKYDERQRTMESFFGPTGKKRKTGC